MAFTDPNRRGKETQLNKILQHDAILVPKQAFIPHLVGTSQERYLSTCYSPFLPPAGAVVPMTFLPHRKSPCFHMGYKPLPPFISQ